MQKYIIGAIALILIGGGGYYAWKSYGSVSNEPEPQAPSVQEPTTRTYATSTFSIVIPREFTVDDGYVNTSVNPKKPISGVKFVIPGTMATGTNLSADSGVSVEWLPRAQNCTGDIYLAANVRASTLSLGGKSYSVATSSGAAAGNRYEEYIYAIPGSSPCTAVRYYIHSTNIGNYEPGTVREFDQAQLVRIFDTIRDSLTFRSAAPATSTTP